MFSYEESNVQCEFRTFALSFQSRYRNQIRANRETLNLTIFQITLQFLQLLYVEYINCATYMASINKVYLYATRRIFAPKLIIYIYIKYKRKNILVHV